MVAEHAHAAQRVHPGDGLIRDLLAQHHMDVPWCPHVPGMNLPAARRVHVHVRQERVGGDVICCCFTHETRSSSHSIVWTAAWVMAGLKASTALDTVASLSDSVPFSKVGLKSCLRSLWIERRRLRKCMVALGSCTGWSSFLPSLTTPSSMSFARRGGCTAAESFGRPFLHRLVSPHWSPSSFPRCMNSSSRTSRSWRASVIPRRSCRRLKSLCEFNTMERGLVRTQKESRRERNTQSLERARLTRLVTVVFVQHSVQHKTEIVLPTLLLLGLSRAYPPTLIVCSPTLAPQKFLDILCAVRTFRGCKRPFTRNEWLSHWGRILGQNVQLKWVVAPQRRWSSSYSWIAAGLACGASPHCRWSRDLTIKHCLVKERAC